MEVDSLVCTSVEEIFYHLALTHGQYGYSINLSLIVIRTMTSELDVIVRKVS